MKIREWAAGRWPEIIRTLIGHEYVDSKRHHKCPKGDGVDRFRFSDLNGRGNYFCQCSNGDEDGFELIMCVKGCDFAEAVQLVESVIGPCPKDDKMPEPRKQTMAHKIRREVVKTKKSEYLDARGLEIPPALDWHKNLQLWTDGVKMGTFPAMLGPITRVGKFLTYHATYLTGMKSGIAGEKVRKILKADCAIRGAAIELYPLEGDTLGVAEGIETAIAAKMLFNIPVWSVISTSLMTGWKPPENIKTVRIFADNDENFAGQAAAYALAHRLHGKIEVTVNMPPILGDWNDYLLQRKREANNESASN